MTASALAGRAADVIIEKLGEDVVELDLRGHSSLADYFVVATATSTVHAQALAEEVIERLKGEGERAYHVEGMENGQWVLLDYVDVVVHIFLSDVRQFYGLERLWGDLPSRRIPSFNSDSRQDDSADGGADRRL